jgi:sigma-B regulation protein RsbU (phosphoserine phosphatase)
MKAISGITDPDQLVSVYWEGIGEFLPPTDHYVSLSRRGIEPPEYLITRSSRFTTHYNPWKERDKLPRMRGGILGEIVYADAPVIIEDLSSRLKRDDPAYFYLEGFQSAFAIPQYDHGKGLNVSISLMEPGVEFDRAILPMIHWQASLFGRATQNLVLKNELEVAHRQLDRELQVVGAIQRSLLPQELPPMPGFDLAAGYRTSARAGGDYYDFFPLDDDAQGIFIADVSGHGTPAAVLMAITHAIAHTRPGHPFPPGALLSYINRHLAKSYAPNGTFVTAFYATLDPRSRRLTYASAGHNPPRLVRAGKVVSLDNAVGLPMGIRADEVFPEAAITLEPGDLLILYTDGITEAMAPADERGAREQFGLERLDALLLSLETASAERCIAAIWEAVTAFTRGTPATDDQTLIAVRAGR